MAAAHRSASSGPARVGGGRATKVGSGRGWGRAGGRGRAGGAGREGPVAWLPVILVDGEHLGASRPDRSLFDDLSLTVSTGDRVGIIGINGTGKSTLMAVLVGGAEPERGVVRRGRGVRVGVLGQEPRLPPGTVSEAVGSGWEAAALLGRVGMGDLASADVSTLSGGQAKRVALAAVLARPADLLALDEPTNHLDIDAIAWLEGWLADFRGGLVLVTHDRHLLDRVTTRMVELDRGAAYVHDGGYASYLEARSEREAHAAAAESTRRNLARAELVWLRRGAPARSRKPRARVEAANAVVNKVPPAGARSRSIDLAAAGTSAPVAGSAPLATPRLGDKVVELHDVGHRFGDDAWLFEHVELSLDPRGRLGVLGANGTGKTTLLDLIAGRLQPASGTIERGPTAVVGYSDQLGRRLDPAQRVRQAVAGPARQPGWEDAALMERFWFDGDAQWAPIGTLSGGERRRLQLLLVLAERPNVLLLDEPTNDLDLDTLRSLEDYLEDWPGSLVVVSHDRAFLERTVDEAVALDLPGRLGLVPGGYSGWEQLRAGRRSRRSTPASPVVAARSGDHASSVTALPAVHDAHDAHDAGSYLASDEPPRGRARTPSTLRRLLVNAERELESAAARREQLVTQLSEARRDHVELGRVATELAAADTRVAAAEERWLEVAEELGA